MELGLLTIFGATAWWGVVLGDSDEEEETRAAGSGGRRREVVDVNVERRTRAHSAMVEIPKPGYLVVKRGVAAGYVAADNVLEMMPVVKTAWTQRVNSFRRGERSHSSNEESMPVASMLDEFVSFVQHRGKRQTKDKRTFDRGAAILGEPPTPKHDEGVADCKSTETPTETSSDTAKETQHCAFESGHCVICFEENPM